MTFVTTWFTMNDMNKTKQTPSGLKISDFEDKTLLIVDDDDPLRNRLSRAMTQKGFEVSDAKTVENAIKMVKSNPPKFALVDLRLEDGNGLDVIKEINKQKSDARIVMLTGYGNLPTAVAAVKAGAIDYMAKPVDADDVVFGPAQYHLFSCPLRAEIRWNETKVW